LSLSTTIGLICLIGLIIVFVIKFLNLLNKRKFYKSDLALVGIFLALLFWVGYMASMGSALIAEDLITSGTDTYVLNTHSDFYNLQAYYWITVVFFVLNLLMGFIELMLGVNLLVKEYDGREE